MSINPNEKKTVLLGLSGGVDSTAACLVLKEAGYNVMGFFFDVTGSNAAGLKDAQRVADELGIELIHEDLSAEFSDIVIDNFIHEYLKGRTPNPCVMCNPSVKFRFLKETADKNRIDYIATGHYARIMTDGDGYKHIAIAENVPKDQSYMLYRLDQSILERLILPLGEFASKDEIRAMVKKSGISNFAKHDSQEICFIEPNDNYKDYIRRKGYDAVKGNFLDSEGKVLGPNKGILEYTIGQRKGLGIALGKPAFVTAINSENGDVTLGDNADLFSTEVVSTDNRFMVKEPEKLEGKRITAKVRYSASPSPAVLHFEGDRVVCTFETPQRAVTPGQSVVFYDDKILLGGGFILE